MSPRVFALLAFVFVVIVIYIFAMAHEAITGPDLVSVGRMG